MRALLTSCRAAGLCPRDAPVVSSEAEAYAAATASAAARWNAVTLPTEKLEFTEGASP